MLTARPMGPPPRMSTKSPALKGLMSTACQATASGSVRADGGSAIEQDASDESSHGLPPIFRLTLSGSLYTALRGTATCSDSPPPQPTMVLAPHTLLFPRSSTHR